MYFITDMQIWKALFKMTNSAIFHDNEVLLNQNIRLTMCLFENKWINKEKTPGDFSLNCYLNFEKRQKKKERSFQKEFPVGLTSSSSTILNRFFMKVKLLYFFTYIFSSILTVKHLSVNFVCFLILLEKCWVKRPICYREMIHMLLNFTERFQIYFKIS